MKSKTQSSWYILPAIVIAQFFCTSLWFAGNSIMGDLINSFQLESTALGHLTSAVQFGFIVGTLVFAILSLADRFDPSKVFFGSAILAALFNLGTIWDGHQIYSLVSLRFFTGFFLAGIYPVGMKIAADYFKKGLGKSLGYLVGALVLGTAFPHLFKGISDELPWKSVIKYTSGLATLGGGLLLVLVPNGPYRKAGIAIKWTGFIEVFKNRTFKSAAFGYFGHMWELYAFWAFVPIILETYTQQNEIDLNISLWAFLIIAVGSLSCIIGGYFSLSFGSKKVAFIALSLSGLCCLLSPFIFGWSLSVFLAFLLFWGMMVIADSPMFSTLVAQNASPEVKGTALTIVNCVGFAITIVSIQLLTHLFEYTQWNGIYLLLGIGPIFGLLNLIKIKE